MPKEEERIPRPRLETFSDLIFGLALTIGAFSLLTSNPPTNLTDVSLDLLAFGFSFLILISIWMRYTGIMSVLPVETGTTVFLNIVLLFLVSLEPYFFNLVTLFSHNAGDLFLNEASIFYALDMTGLSAVIGFFTHQLTIEERRLVPNHLLGEYKQDRNSLFVASGIFLVSIAPQFWAIRVSQTPLRFLIWGIPIVLLQVMRFVHSLRRSRIVARSQSTQ